MLCVRHAVLHTIRIRLHSRMCGTKKPILEINPENGCVVIIHESMKDAAVSFGLKVSSTAGIFNACKSGEIYFGSKWKYNLDDDDVRKRNNRKPVLNLDRETGSIMECFESITQAGNSVQAKNMSSTISCISSCCNGRTSHAYGFVWKFIPKIVVTSCWRTFFKKYFFKSHLGF